MVCREFGFRHPLGSWNVLYTDKEATIWYLAMLGIIFIDRQVEISRQIMFCGLFFETGSHYVALAGTELAILVPRPP
jgi:hypothetical protein